MTTEQQVKEDIREIKTDIKWIKQEFGGFKIEKEKELDELKIKIKDLEIAKETGLRWQIGNLVAIVFLLVGVVVNFIVK